MPGGSHPPLKQVQSGPGRAVVQAADDDGGGACGTTGDEDGGVMSGGIHPPLTQIQFGPGCGEVHCADASSDCETPVKEGRGTEVADRPVMRATT